MPTRPPSFADGRSAAFRRGFAILTAGATLALIAVGGLVTSHGAGMAVPDWPNSYGYNMFLFPVGKWVGGILYEHSHRLIATMVGVLVVALARWLGGSASRKQLATFGAIETILGLAVPRFAPEWRSAGYFLSGIGVVVLLAALVWVRNAPAPRPLPALGWIAFVLVQVQGLLGGLRVVLLKDELGIFHATMAQLFFAMLCVIAALAGRQSVSASGTVVSPRTRRMASWIGIGTALILCQLILGATMRHEHAGLAIPDFPLAYGRLWPATDAASVELFNQRRLELTSMNPITATQIQLQMAHRLGAVLILTVVAACAWLARRDAETKSVLGTRTLAWLGLILLQALLGAATIWSNKAADIATGHVVLGALSLAWGVLMTLRALGFCAAVPFEVPASAGPSGRTRTAASESLTAGLVMGQFGCSSRRLETPKQ